MRVCWNTSGIASGMCPPNMLSFLQKLWLVFSTSASFLYNSFSLPLLWTSSLTFEVPAHPRKRSSQFQTSLLYVKNLISPTRSISSCSSHPISVDPQSHRHISQQNRRPTHQWNSVDYNILSYLLDARCHPGLEACIHQRVVQSLLRSGEKRESQLTKRGMFLILLTCTIDIYSPFRPLSLS